MKFIVAIFFTLTTHFEMAQSPVRDTSMKQLQNYLQKNIKYSPNLVKENLEGKVIIKFVVNKFGLVTNAGVARGISISCDTLVLNKIKNYNHKLPLKEGAYTIGAMFFITDQGDIDEDISFDINKYPNFLFGIGVKGIRQTHRVQYN